VQVEEEGLRRAWGGVRNGLAGGQGGGREDGDVGGGGCHALRGGRVGGGGMPSGRCAPLEQFSDQSSDIPVC
jgi:hypothetical protein